MGLFDSVRLQRNLLQCIRFAFEELKFKNFKINCSTKFNGDF